MVDVRRPTAVVRSSDTAFVSVVVPVFGGGTALTELRDRLDATMRRLGFPYELILVDDRGPGEAWSTIAALSDRHPEVIGVRLARNFGQHAATICGLGMARGEWVVTMDDDLEHAPESIPDLLAAADEGHPLVYGVFEQRTHSAFRNVTSELMRSLLKRAFPELNQEYSSFRLMHMSLAKRLDGFDLHRPYIDGFLSWMTSSVRAVSIAHDSRRHGRSGYTLPRLISHAINIFVTFSHLPLRLATYVGGVISISGFLYLVYIVYDRLTGGIASPGYASLMSVLLLVCGVQLMILGVIGEYIGRLMGATYRRPMYIIEVCTNRP